MDLEKLIIRSDSSKHFFIKILSINIFFIILIVNYLKKSLEKKFKNIKIPLEELIANAYLKEVNPFFELARSDKHINRQEERLIRKG